MGYVAAAWSARGCRGPSLGGARGLRLVAPVLSPGNLPSHAQEVGVCVFCNQRSKEPLTPYNFEMVKWMSFRGEWCHRACFEQFRQEHDKFVKVSLGDPTPRCF